MTLPEPTWRVKSRPCPFYAKGRCLFAERCNFLHDGPATTHSASIMVPAGRRPSNKTWRSPLQPPTVTIESPRSSYDQSPPRSPRMESLISALKDVIGEAPLAPGEDANDEGAREVCEEDEAESESQQPSPSGALSEKQAPEANPLESSSISDDGWTVVDDVPTIPIPAADDGDSNDNDEPANIMAPDNAPQIPGSPLLDDRDGTRPLHSPPSASQNSPSDAISPPTLPTSDLLSPMNLSVELAQLAPFVIQDPQEAGIIDANEQWRPSLSILSPPRSPGVNSTFDLLASPFGPLSARVLSPRFSSFFIPANPSSPIHSHHHSHNHNHNHNHQPTRDEPSAYDLDSPTEHAAALSLSLSRLTTPVEIPRTLPASAQSTPSSSSFARRGRKTHHPVVPLTPIHVPKEPLGTEHIIPVNPAAAAAAAAEEEEEEEGDEGDESDLPALSLSLSPVLLAYDASLEREQDEIGGRGVRGVRGGEAEPPLLLARSPDPPLDEQSPTILAYDLPTTPLQAETQNAVEDADAPVVVPVPVVGCVSTEELIETLSVSHASLSLSGSGSGSGGSSSSSSSNSGSTDYLGAGNQDQDRDYHFGDYYTSPVMSGSAISGDGNNDGYGGDDDDDDDDDEDGEDGYESSREEDSLDDDDDEDGEKGEREEKEEEEEEENAPRPESSAFLLASTAERREALDMGIQETETEEQEQEQEQEHAPYVVSSGGSPVAYTQHAPSIPHAATTEERSPHLALEPTLETVETAETVEIVERAEVVAAAAAAAVVEHEQPGQTILHNADANDDEDLDDDDEEEEDKEEEEEEEEAASTSPPLPPSDIVDNPPLAPSSHPASIQEIIQTPSSPSLPFSEASIVLPSSPGSSPTRQAPLALEVEEQPSSMGSDVLRQLPTPVLQTENDGDDAPLEDNFDLAVDSVVLVGFEGLPYEDDDDDGDDNDDEHFSQASHPTVHQDPIRPQEQEQDQEQERASPAPSESSRRSLDSLSSPLAVHDLPTTPLLQTEDEQLPQLAAASPEHLIGPLSESSSPSPSLSLSSLPPLDGSSSPGSDAGASEQFEERLGGNLSEMREHEDPVGYGSNYSGASSVGLPGGPMSRADSPLDRPSESPLLQEDVYLGRPSEGPLLQEDVSLDRSPESPLQQEQVSPDLASEDVLRAQNEQSPRLVSTEPIFEDLSEPLLDTPSDGSPGSNAGANARFEDYLDGNPSESREQQDHQPEMINHDNNDFGGSPVHLTETPLPHMNAPLDLPSDSMHPEAAPVDDDDEESRARARQQSLIEQIFADEALAQSPASMRDSAEEETDASDGSPVVSLASPPPGGSQQDNFDSLYDVYSADEDEEDDATTDSTNSRTPSMMSAAGQPQRTPTVAHFFTGPHRPEFIRPSEMNEHEDLVSYDGNDSRAEPVDMSGAPMSRVDVPLDRPLESPLLREDVSLDRPSESPLLQENVPLELPSEDVSRVENEQLLLLVSAEDLAEDLSEPSRDLPLDGSLERNADANAQIENYFAGNPSESRDQEVHQPTMVRWTNNDSGGSPAHLTETPLSQFDVPLNLTSDPMHAETAPAHEDDEESKARARQQSLIEQIFADEALAQSSTFVPDSAEEETDASDGSPVVSLASPPPGGSQQDNFDSLYDVYSADEDEEDDETDPANFRTPSTISAGQPQRTPTAAHFFTSPYRPESILFTSSSRERQFTPPMNRRRSELILSISHSPRSAPSASPTSSAGSISRGRNSPFSSDRNGPTNSTRSQSPEAQEVPISTKVPFGFRNSFALNGVRNSTLASNRLSRPGPLIPPTVAPPLSIDTSSPLDSLHTTTPRSAITPSPNSASYSLRPLRLSTLLTPNPFLPSTPHSRASPHSPFSAQQNSSGKRLSISSSSSSVASGHSLTPNTRLSLIPEHSQNTQTNINDLSPLSTASQLPHLSNFRESSSAPISRRASWRSVSPISREQVSYTRAPSRLSRAVRSPADERESQKDIDLEYRSTSSASIRDRNVIDVPASNRISRHSLRPKFSPITPHTAPAPSSHTHPASHRISHAIATPRPTLMFAIASDDVEQVKQALENGDSGPNDTVGPQSALEFVLTNDKLTKKMEIVKTLLAYGADPAPIVKRMEEVAQHGEAEGAVPSASQSARGTPSSLPLSVVRDLVDELDPATRYYVNRADAPHTRRTSALIHRSFFRPLTRVRYELVGQDRAIEQLFRVLNIHSRQLSNTPIVVLLCGPSGHGKSLLARKFGALLDVPTHTVNMTTLRSTHDLWKSYSMSPYETPTSCTLAEFLINNEGKRCVVVLDEIEKTDDEKTLWSLLMPWELGRCSFEASSRHIDVRSVVWLGTSNIGHDLVFKDHEERGSPDEMMSREDYVALMDKLRPKVSDRLGASIMSRVTTVLPFVPFTSEEKKAICSEALHTLAGEMLREISPKAIEKAVEGALKEYNLVEGARSLYRAISNKLIDLV